MADHKKIIPRNEGVRHIEATTGDGYPVSPPVQEQKQPATMPIRKPQEESPKPAVKHGRIGKPKISAFRSAIVENQKLVLGSLAGGVLLLVVLAGIGWQLGWFSSREKKAPVAAAPAALAQPMPPVPPAQGASPVDQEPGNEAPKTAASPGDDAGKSPSAQEQPPSLPDDVAKWKREDYFRARREKDPKLLEAVEYLGKKVRGSGPAAEGLADLLKPLPTESPPATNQSSQESKLPPQESKLPPQESKPKQPPRKSKPSPQKLMFSPLRDNMRPPPPQDGMSPPPRDLRPPPLQELVSPPSQDWTPPPQESMFHEPGEFSKLVETIVTALGNNGSDTARNTLEQILAGTIVTDDDRLAVEVALKALAAHPGQQNDALLLRAIAASEALRPADRQGPWPAKELRLKALASIRPVASSEFRIKLAEAMGKRLFRLDPRDPIREFLLVPDPLSCGAQIVIYENADTPKEIRSSLEQQFAGYSSSVMARLVGVSNESQINAAGPGYPWNPGYPGSPPAKPIDPSIESRLAEQLWSERFHDAMESQLDELRVWEKQPHLVLLASTIPQDSTRAALVKAFRKHWSEGPKALEAAGLIDRIVTDPGLLVLIKMFPRKDPKSAKAAIGGARASAPAKPGPPKKEQKEQAEQDWMVVSAKLVAIWCNRFHVLALAKEKAAAETGQLVGDAATKLPDDWELNNNAKVVVAYHILWPEDAPPAMSPQKPSFLEIHYLRAQEVGKPKRVIGFYSRQARIKPTELRTIDRGVVWLDSPRSSPQSDRRRSFDVLITRTEDRAVEAAKDDEETDLVIEMLSIEIKGSVDHE